MDGITFQLIKETQLLCVVSKMIVYLFMLVTGLVQVTITFLRFVVNEDMFSDPNILAQATFLVKGIHSGRIHTLICGA